MINKLGKFGAFVKNYEKARREFPREVFIFLKSLLKTKSPLILDLGCGTGISTRQLAPLGKVIGCDPDPRMLRAAKRHGKIGKGKYVIGVADRLPFKDSIFDVVTAFSAFHWFDDAKSIKEIKRVLKPGGIFFVGNKSGVRSWGKGYRQAIIKAISREAAEFRTSTYNPRQRLEESGFKNIKVLYWRKSELFTLQNALEFVQSVSIWNSVPVSLRSKAIKGLEKHFIALKRSTGKIERKLTVQAIAGRIDK